MNNFLPNMSINKPDIIHPNGLSKLMKLAEIDKN